MVPRKKHFDCFLECLIAPQSNQHIFLSKKILIFHISIQLNFYFDDIEPPAKRVLTKESHFNIRPCEGPLHSRPDLKSAIRNTGPTVHNNTDHYKTQTDIHHITATHQNVTGESEPMDIDSDNMIINDKNMNVDNNDIDNQDMDIL